MKSVCLVSNAYAGSVSLRTKEVIVKALQADFKLEVADTESRAHATELARDAVDRGFDAVVAFGGDGTINEAAQGLAGTDVALGFIPGGSTNVVARSLGVPRDPVEATAFVASHLRSGTMRTINLGRMNERYFLFCAGVGLDAEVVKRVEADPEAKRRRGEWFFLSNALKAGFTQYRNADPAITVEIPGREPRRSVLAVCCNGRPFTYFKKMPVDVCPEARLDAGLDVFALERIRTGTIPRIAWALLVSRSHVGWRNSLYAHDLQEATIRCDYPLPVQVDGDYLGELDEVQLTLVPAALRLLV
ncbi:MAG TPA: diacylglycerol kinase family protein [Actinomycetota bacterium]|nr:diacylglycerol kinase family protein [Actinomycetota bacterium]